MPLWERHSQGVRIDIRGGSDSNTYPILHSNTKVMHMSSDSSE